MFNPTVRPESSAPDEVFRLVVTEPEPTVVKGARTAVLHIKPHCLFATLTPDGLQEKEPGCGLECPARNADHNAYVEFLDVAGRRVCMIDATDDMYGNPQLLGGLNILLALRKYLDPEAVLVAVRMKKYRDVKRRCITYWDAEGRAETHSGHDTSDHAVRLADDCVVEPEFDGVARATSGCVLL